jgi:hypothetical protein
MRNQEVAHLLETGDHSVKTEMKATSMS